MVGILRVLPLLHRISKRSLSHHEVTSRFLDFFKGRQHTIVPSSPLLAPPETGLLFTNSGMNQFHRILSGHETPTAKRVASLQDCVRVGGKHNDLLEVGQDGHHHTFFQMLGNWSFGDYFKDEACRLALELLTSGYNLKREDLVVTYFGGDPGLGIPADAETRDMWLKLGLSEKAIEGKGVHDNFWEMGKTGPCGPCTEIHVNVQGQLREIWNLVFIQYNRMSDESLQALETPFVDTGMGLERLCALLQGKTSNYDTDLFEPLIRYLEKESGKSYTGSFTTEEDCAFRLVTDHCRMASKAIAQGILPENNDAGNKVRRVLRRACHAAHDRLNLKPGALATLSVLASDSLGLDNSESLKSIIDEEERRYLATLKRANIILLEGGDTKILSGSTAWKLYQHCGLPRDNITDICAQRGIRSVDWAEFNECLEEFKVKSQGVNPLEAFNLPKHADAVTNAKVPGTDYSTVYTAQLEMQSDVLYASQEGPRAVIVVRETCFYPESGGQVSDTGMIRCDSAELEVVHVVKVGNHLFHLCNGKAPAMRTKAHLEVDKSRRNNCTQHHTAAHLLNAAIKKQLGPTAVQKSSLVDEKHFRLDIVSKNPVDVRSIEDFINEAIRSNYAVKCDEVSREDIMNDPAVVKLPNEVYPPRVRLVQCGSVSREPCCGTHVTSTGEIPSVVVVNSRSAGVNVKIVTATATRAKLARDNAEQLKLEIGKLEERSKALSENYPEILTARKQLRSLRRFMSTELLPQLDLNRASDQLSAIEARIVKQKKLSSKSLESEMRARVMVLEGDPVVGSVVLDCEEQLLYRTLKQLDKAHFIMLASCGSIFLQCKVPNSYGFTAQQWVESFLKAIDSPPLSPPASNGEHHLKLRIDTKLPLNQLEEASIAVLDELQRVEIEMRENHTDK